MAQKSGVFVFIGAAAVAVFGSPGEVKAASDSSDWIGDRRAEFRLVAGDASQGGKIQAGVEIRLAPGWKTYWRYPGDSGVPPTFDFARSDNVKSVQVSWPAPKRLVDSEGVTIGYKERVLFPLRVEPKEPGKPVVLRLKLDYAICEKLCIPVQGSAALPVGAKGSHGAAIAAAEKAVPQARALAADAPLAVKAFHHDPAAKPARVLVDVATPAGAAPEVFAEGPTADWALPVPEPAGEAGGLQRFAFSLEGMPPGADSKGAAIKLTVVAGSEAIETTLRLD